MLILVLSSDMTAASLKFIEYFGFHRLRLRSLILRQARPTSVPWYKKFNWYSFALYRYKALPGNY